jgi:hypothetical protein
MESTGPRGGLDSPAFAIEYYAMSLPAAYLSQKLTQPLPIKDGGVLRTVGEAASYVLSLDQAEHCNRWGGRPNCCSSRPT